MPEEPNQPLGPAPAGSRHAADQFVEATYRVVLAFLLRLVRNRLTAEDLTQATYEAVFRRADFDASRRDALGFLKKRARWVLADHRRKQGFDLEMLPADLVDPRAGDPARALETEELRQRVRRGVARLPKAHQAVMVRHLDGMDHQQIASELHLSPATVYKRFHNAKVRLRRLFENEE
jgi:RNA polymerase sigma factor (sigma-70 family)